MHFAWSRCLPSSNRCRHHSSLLLLFLIPVPDPHPSLCHRIRPHLHPTFSSLFHRPILCALPLRHALTIVLSLSLSLTLCHSLSLSVTLCHSHHLSPIHPLFNLRPLCTLTLIYLCNNAFPVEASPKSCHHLRPFSTLTSPSSPCTLPFSLSLST